MMLAPNIRFQQQQQQQPLAVPVPGHPAENLPADWENQLQEAYETGYADGMQEARDQCFNVGKKTSSRGKKDMTFIESLTPKLNILPGVKKKSKSSSKSS